MGVQERAGVTLLCWAPHRAEMSTVQFLTCWEVLDPVLCIKEKSITVYFFSCITLTISLGACRQLYPGATALHHSSASAHSGRHKK